MKKLGYFLVSLIALLGATSAMAEDDSGWNPVVLGIYGGGQTGTDVGHANAAGFLMVRQAINQYASISFQGGAMYAPSKFSSLLSDLTVVSYELVPRLYIAPGWEKMNPPEWAPGIARPYLSAGAGYYNINESGEGIGDYTGTVGGVFGGGVDYLITPNMAAGIDIAYIYLRPHYNAPGIPQQTANLDMLRLTAGIRFRLPSSGAAKPLPSA